MLHEGTPGLFANQQIAAVAERMETATFREAGLRLAGA
ncbi:hypothetical protein NOCARDAX2BIS_420039 [Nocardioides sp. AX2bis]|nr:hypothetical protein NOCARDAX2BIS_420039 [Nocardioides sp. AX2bis]